MGSAHSCGCFDGITSRRRTDRASNSESAPPEKQSLPDRLPPETEEGSAAVKGAASDTESEESEASEEPEPILARSEHLGSLVAGATVREPAVPRDRRRSSSASPEGNGAATSGLPPSAIAGTWRYCEVATYRISEEAAGRWRFEESHDTGRSVSGIMWEQGPWMKGDLRFTDNDEECGTIRMRLMEDEGVLCSNFRPAGENWWSQDMIANKEVGEKRHSILSMESDHKDSVKPQADEATVTGSPRTEVASKKAGLEQIPTRVKAKLARSMSGKKRRGGPSMQSQSSGGRPSESFRESVQHLGGARPSMEQPPRPSAEQSRSSSGSLPRLRGSGELGRVPWWDADGNSSPERTQRPEPEYMAWNMANVGLIGAAHPGTAGRAPMLPGVPDGDVPGAPCCGRILGGCCRHNTAIEFNELEVPNPS